MGSDLRSSLGRTADARAAFERKFGGLPMSILRIHRGALSRRMFTYQQENIGRSASGKRAMKAMVNADEFGDATVRRRQVERLALGLVGNVDRKTPGGRLNATTMPAELVEFFVKYYARAGQTYLDPFMGQGIQMQVAKLKGMHYYGYDVSDEFFPYCDAVRRKIDDGTTQIRIVHGDSRRPDEVPDGIGDFSFHSPPYWDIEFYGDEAGQLGQGATYPEFLRGMQDVAAAWLPKFKAGAWHVVNVNDFRKGGVFYPYHADTIDLFRRAGWVLVDTWIIDGLVGGMSKIFAVQKNLGRIAPKVHEYALVFRCP